MSKHKRFIYVSTAILILCCGVSITACVLDTAARKIGWLPTFTPEPTATNTTIPVIAKISTLVSEPSATLTPTSTPLPTLSIFFPQIISGIKNLATIPGFECLPEFALQEMGEVVGIINGDTIEVQVGGDYYEVRYIGIDAPEIDDPFGPEAKEINYQFVEGKHVILVKDTTDTDRDDRLLRYVFVDGMFVNYELVKSGFAKSVSSPPDVACQEIFNHGQEEAIRTELGVWQIVQAIGTPLPASQAQVDKDVIITHIFYDGKVKRVESDEYVVITNVGTAPVNLAGWRLNAGSQGQNFRFPMINIYPGQTCRVYTNENHPEYCGFSFRSPEELWNNGGDCGYLYNDQGAQVDSYCY